MVHAGPEKFFGCRVLAGLVTLPGLALPGALLDHPLCRRCGHQNRRGARFCARCGAALPAVCRDACDFSEDWTTSRRWRRRW